MKKSKIAMYNYNASKRARSKIEIYSAGGSLVDNETEPKEGEETSDT